MPEEDFDDPLGQSTGAGVIFGGTGGVLEAALRTVYEKVTGKELYIPGLKDGDFPLRPLHSPELKQTIEFILIYL